MLWQSKKGRKLLTLNRICFDELLFANSLDKSKMPHFITNHLTQDALVDTGSVDQQSTLTDLPSADSIFELPPSDVCVCVCVCVCAWGGYQLQLLQQQCYQMKSEPRR